MDIGKLGVWFFLDAMAAPQSAAYAQKVEKLGYSALWIPEAVGREPFRVVELFTEDPLLEGSVDYLDDRYAQESPETQKSLVEIYEVCHTLIFGDYPRDGTAQEEQIQLSYTIASKLPMDLLWKQRVLELRTEAERQERLLAYLRDWAPHLQKVETQHRRAAGHGSGLN